MHQHRPGTQHPLTIALTVYVLARLNPEHAPLAPKVPLREKIAMLSGVGPMLLLLMSVTGVIYTRTATPTEASALGAFFAGVLYLLRRGFDRVELPQLLNRAVRTIHLILGCFLDQMAILVLTVPIVAPLVASLGFDLVWFGIIVIAELGLVTPPMGLNAFVVSQYLNTTVTEVFRGIVPHVFSHLVEIALLLAFPAIVLWLPAHM